MCNRTVFELFIIVVLLGVVSTQGFSQTNLPALGGRVNDYALILSRNDAEKISAFLDDFEKRTGIQAVAVTIDSISTFHPGNPECLALATALANFWGVGRSGINDGALVLIAAKDQKLCIAVGSGYGDTLNVAMSEVIKAMVPYFKRNEFGEGLYQGTRALAQVLESRQIGPSQAAQIATTTRSVERSAPNLVPRSLSTGSGQQMYITELLFFLLLFSPVIAGGFIALAQNDRGVSIVERLGLLLTEKFESFRVNGDGNWWKNIARIALWPIIKLIQWTASVQNQYWRSGVRVVAGGYVGFLVVVLTALIFYLAIVLVVTVAVLAFVAYALSQGSRSSSSTLPSALTRFWKETDDADVRIRRTESGSASVYERTAVGDREIGRVDDKGRVFETTGMVDKEVARIDEGGRIHDTTELTEEEIGRIDHDGRVYDRPDVTKK